MPPETIVRYFNAADSADFQTLAECFTPTGTVVDEDITYQGRDEIVGWRESTATKWEYTSEVTGSERADDGAYLATVHVEGNFPGGVADLHYRFELVADKISSLTIQ
jgi:hypothetical protein